LRASRKREAAKLIFFDLRQSVERDFSSRKQLEWVPSAASAMRVFSKACSISSAEVG
jgi:hypothetical protein